ncbi:Alpha/Beta hydrolase protein [Tricladium varicosporioides]|nr:Alpha/Beta hydrolase protein [Hymenoscyphus varicosporioides]
MPSIKWQPIQAAPLTAFKVTIRCILSSIPEILKVVTYQTPISIWASLAKIWVGTFFEYIPDMWYSEPRNTVQKIESNGMRVFVIPNIRPEEIKHVDAVYLYAHEGGMMIGHPLQYLTEYERWVTAAAAKGKKLVILAPVYPLSPQKKWPAQRDAMKNVYDLVVNDLLVPTSKLIIGGDSAGGNLALLTLLYLRNNSKPLPVATVLYSPFLDMTAALTRYTPRIATDFMFGFSAFVPMQNDILRPEDLPFDTPEISALLWQDISGLPPQLIFWSTTEVLASDSERWVAKSREAGVKTKEWKESGQLHTFALGFPFVGAEKTKKYDEAVIKFIFSHV